MTDNVYWIIKFDINDDEAEQRQLAQIAATLSELTSEEPEVVAYEWAMSADQKRLHIHERYANSKAALAHLHNVGPHLGELSSLATPTAVECYGPVGEAFKDAVRAYPMEYYSLFEGFMKN